MILVFGGTSETAPLAETLAGSGFHVLVSTATDIALKTGDHRHIRRRCGRLDADELRRLLNREGIRAVVDASHPYAVALHDMVRSVCTGMGIPLIRYRRPASAVGDFKGLHWAADHDEAARLACLPGRRLLLTIGSGNLLPYIRCARSRKAALFARVLPEPESLDTCLRAGLPHARIVAARGPFSVEDNRALLRLHRIQVLVSKESGAAGGFEAKLRAAESENCRVVVVRRPMESGIDACGRIEAVAEKLKAVLTSV